MANIANEITEYNKLGICMKSTAESFGMACGCKECLSNCLKWIEKELVVKE